MGLIITAFLPSLIALKILFFMLGVLSSSSTIAFALLANEYSLNLRSTVIAIAALIENIIGALVQSLFGWIVDIIKYINLSSHFSYQAAMQILPLALLICYLISKKLYRQHDYILGVGL